MPQQAIQAHARRIRVPYLVHFTRVANLPSILQHGLYPVSRTAEVGVAPVVNDELRLDGHRNATSLSIAFPNYRMFWKYRQENVGVDWVVLGAYFTERDRWFRESVTDAVRLHSY